MIRGSKAPKAAWPSSLEPPRIPAVDLRKGERHTGRKVLDYRGIASQQLMEVVEGIAILKEELKPEVMRVVFKDAGFADDVVKTNAVQILRQAGIEDVKSL